MFTEWLCELPIDLEENWFVKFCPYGKRCLVVAEKVKLICINVLNINLCIFSIKPLVIIEEENSYARNSNHYYLVVIVLDRETKLQF